MTKTNYKELYKKADEKLTMLLNQVRSASNTLDILLNDVLDRLPDISISSKLEEISRVLGKCLEEGSKGEEIDTSSDPSRKDIAPFYDRETANKIDEMWEFYQIIKKNLNVSIESIEYEEKDYDEIYDEMIKESLNRWLVAGLNCSEFVAFLEKYKEKE